MRRRFVSALLLGLFAACHAASGPERTNGAQAPAAVDGDSAAPAATAGDKAEQPEERASGAEAPPGGASAAGAAAAAEAYFAAIAAGRFGEAWRLLGEGGRPEGATGPDFAAAFADYAEYHAEVGTPGRIEGAAGSLWVEVPVRVRGRMRDGETFDKSGVVVLRRCNHVPGCTPDQRSWRIEAENIGLSR